MNVLVAADKFKGSLTSFDVATAIKRGLKRVRFPVGQTLTIEAIPVSDGGDGFLDAIEQSMECSSKTQKRVAVDTVDPIGRPIKADYLHDLDSNTAYVELAGASGLSLLSLEERNPMHTSTFGTGVIIAAALDAGAKQIVVGIGGSATNDGGTGIAAALGVSFLDSNGKIIQRPTGEALSRMERVDVSNRRPLVPILAVNDVANPLTGPDGAAHVFASQKGATSENIEQLDSGLVNLAEISRRDLRSILSTGDPSSLPGAGAAGGVGFGLAAFCNARFVPGAEFVSDLLKLKTRLDNNEFDLVITGEGKIDTQTLSGKWVRHIIELALGTRTPVVAFCGINDLSEADAAKLGLFDVVAIHDPHQRSLSDSVSNAASLLEDQASRWFRTFLKRAIQ